MLRQAKVSIQHNPSANLAARREVLVFPTPTGHREHQISAMCDICAEEDYATASELLARGWYYSQRNALCPECHHDY